MRRFRYLEHDERLILTEQFKRGYLVQNVHGFGWHVLPGGQISHGYLLQTLVDGKRCREVGPLVALFGYLQKCSDQVGLNLEERER